MIIGIITLAIAYFVEFLQQTAFLEVLGLQNNKWANLIFGNSFSIQDLVAYTLGTVLVLLIENRPKKGLIPKLEP